MAKYQKYLFDNFVVDNSKEKKTEMKIEVVEEIAVEPVVEVEQDIAAEAETIIETPQPEPVVQEPIAVEPSFSQDELNAAVKLAEETAYEKGFHAAADDEARRQNILLEDIKNQLMTIFAGLERKTADIESSSLKFAVELVRKILPTLEKERAEAEVKNFLNENFANFAAQEILSFAFNPETVSLVAGSIGRLAEQNDFEGKIAVHKDAALGPSDCRVEWKSGGVERNTTRTLDKVESLIDNNAQERENGE